MRYDGWTRQNRTQENSMFRVVNKYDNRPSYKMLDSDSPFPRQLKADKYGYYKCSLCGSDSNSPNSRMVWVEDINRNYKEHYICSSCMGNWENKHG